MRAYATVLSIVILLLSCVTAGVVTYVPTGRLQAAFESVVLSLQVGMAIASAAAVLTLIICAGLLVWMGYSRGWTWHSDARLKNAEADKTERDSRWSVTIAAPGHQVYGTQYDPKAKQFITDPLHLNSGRANGVQLEPTLEQKQMFIFFNTAHSTTSKPDVVLEQSPQLQAPIPEHVYLEHYATNPTLRNLFLGVGRFPDGQVRPVSAPLARLVNIAIGGGSGFGKSVFMQSLAYQIINARDDVRPVFLDAQGVTFSEWAGDNRLLYPLGRNPGQILTILLALVAEMGRREELFSKWRGVDSIDKYNSVATERLPYIPILFDEFGLVGDDKKITDAAKKLAKGGRKCGIPSISADQTWLADDISSAYRGNLSTSFQFYVRSKSISRILIGDSGAADLLRPGQCLAALPGQPGLIELQAPDVSNLVGRMPQLIEGDVVELPPLPGEEADSREIKITEMIQNGADNSTIARSVFGKPSLSGDNFYLVKNLRRRLLLDDNGVLDGSG